MRRFAPRHSLTKTTLANSIVLVSSRMPRQSHLRSHSALTSTPTSYSSHLHPHCHSHPRPHLHTHLRSHPRAHPHTRAPTPTPSPTHSAGWGTLGTYLSHHLLLEHIVRGAKANGARTNSRVNGSAAFLILQDDTQLAPDWLPRLRLALNRIGAAKGWLRRQTIIHPAR